MSKQCYTNGDFKKYFNENMKAVGVPVPSGLFDSYEKAIATIGAMAGTLHLLGKGATIGELIGATVGLEKLAIATAFGASFYTGVVIGSVFVASGRSATCGARLSDMFVFIKQNELQFEGWQTFYTLNPQILDKTYKFRSSIALKGISSAESFEYA